MDWFLYDKGLRHERVNNDMKAFAKDFMTFCSLQNGVEKN